MSSALAAKNQHQQDTNTVRRKLLVCPALHLHLYKYQTKQQMTTI